MSRDQSHSSDEESDFRKISEANFQRNQDKITKINYIEGVADGRDKAFQESFNLGYADGLRTGIELAKMSGFFEKASEMPKEEFKKEFSAYEKLQLKGATDKTHMKYQEHGSEPMSVGSTKQQSYVDDVMKKFEEQLPNTINLFKSN